MIVGGHILRKIALRKSDKSKTIENSNDHNLYLWKGNLFSVEQNRIKRYRNGINYNRNKKFNEI